jgi:hypothetical protein
MSDWQNTLKLLDASGASPLRAARHASTMGASQCCQADRDSCLLSFPCVLALSPRQYTHNLVVALLSMLVAQALWTHTNRTAADSDVDCGCFGEGTSRVVPQY